MWLVPSCVDGVAGPEGCNYGARQGTRPKNTETKAVKKAEGNDTMYHMLWCEVGRRGD